MIGTLKYKQDILYPNKVTGEMKHMRSLHFVLRESSNSFEDIFMNELIQKIKDKSV